MKYTVLVAKDGQWRLERDISFHREVALRQEGFTVLETWMAVVPTTETVCRLAAHVIQ